MAHSGKIEAVLSYLKAAFPEHNIQNRSRRVTDHDFTISREGVSYTVTVKRTFLDDHTPEEITRLFDDWRLPAAIRKAETACVIVGNGGVAAAYP